MLYLSLQYPAEPKPAPLKTPMAQHASVPTASPPSLHCSFSRSGSCVVCKPVRAQCVTSRRRVHARVAIRRKLVTDARSKVRLVVCLRSQGAHSLVPLAVQTLTLAERMENCLKWRMVANCQTGDASATKPESKAHLGGSQLQ